MFTSKALQLVAANRHGSFQGGSSEFGAEWAFALTPYFAAFWISLLPSFWQLLRCHRWPQQAAATTESSWADVVARFLCCEGMVIIRSWLTTPVALLCISSDFGIHWAAGSLVTQNPPQRLGAFVKPSWFSDRGLQFVCLRLTENPHPGRRLRWVIFLGNIASQHLERRNLELTVTGSGSVAFSSHTP